MAADVQALAAEHAEHQAAADAAAAQLAQRQAEIAAEQATRGQSWDRGLLAEHMTRRRALEAEERDARAAFRQAVLDAPLVAAWVRYRAARHRRASLAQDVSSAAARVGDERRIETLNWRDPRLLEDLVAFAEEAAEDIALEEGADRQRQRDEYVAGAEQ